MYGHKRGKKVVKCPYFRGLNTHTYIYLGWEKVSCVVTCPHREVPVGMYISTTHPSLMNQPYLLGIFPVSACACEKSVWLTRLYTPHYEKSSYVLGSEAWEEYSSGLLSLIKDFVLSVWEERKVRLRIWRTR